MRVLAALLLRVALLTSGPGSGDGPQAAPVPPAPPGMLSGPEKVRVGLVLIEVAVRDRKDLPISGLSLEISSSRAPLQQAPPSTPDQPPATRAVVLYYDFTALSFQARATALKASRDYLAHQQGSSAEFMILGYARGDRTTHQDFTSNRAALDEALARLAKDRATIDLDLPDVLDQLRRLAHARGPACLELAREFALAEQERAMLSLDQLERVVRYLGGRKEKLNVVLLADSLRLESLRHHALHARNRSRRAARAARAAHRRRRGLGDRDLYRACGRHGG